MIALISQDLSPEKHGFEEQFLSMLPQIQEQASRAFRRLGADEREELVAEVVALAYRSFLRLVERGMSDVIYVTPLTDYAVRQARFGRRAGTPLNKYDVSTAYCQRANGIVVDRLDQPGTVDGQWKEILVEDKRFTPAEIAGYRIDFGDWLRRLSSPMRRIAKTLAAGKTTGAAARRHGVTPGRISQFRRELKQSWDVFQVGAIEPRNLGQAL